jgi:SNF2 family DNA or RNA helicase
VTPFIPRDYQEAIIAHALPRRRSNVFAGMGTGKTASVLFVLSLWLLFGVARRILVLAPKRVAKTTWPDEIRKWSNLSHLRCAVAIGTAEERRAALASGAEIVAMNYDNIEWLIDEMGDAWAFDVVIADEATRLKGHRVALRKHHKTGREFYAGQGGARAKALAKIAHRKVERWVNLTGSPAPNGLQDLWGVQWFIDGGQRLGRTYTGFQARWFSMQPRGGRLVPMPLPFAEEQIRTSIADTCIVIEARDYMDLPDMVETDVLVDLPPAVRAAYRKLEREFFVRWEQDEFEAFSSGALMQKLLQFASGAAYTTAPAWALVHDEKIDALRSIVEEAAGMPVLVSVQFRSDRERILAAFKGARDLDDNPQTIRDWNEGRIPVLTAHPKSAGHGLNLQDGGCILTDFSSGFNLEEDEQIIERIGPTRQAQAGHPRTVYRRRIIARDTLEELAVLPSLRRKASVQDSLKAVLKLRNTGIAQMRNRD